jgi:tetratricopeptide (TPR) repeat protein
MALADFNTTIQLNPHYARAYYSRAKVWLHQQKWEKARADLTDAKDMNMDIAVLFHNDYQSIPDFEKQIGVKLPDDIAAMLMQQEEKTQTQPVEESLFQRSNEIDRRLFEVIAKKLAQQERRTQNQSTNLFQPPSGAASRPIAN